MELSALLRNANLHLCNSIYNWLSKEFKIMGLSFEPTVRLVVAGLDNLETKAQ